MYIYIHIYTAVYYFVRIISTKENKQTAFIDTWNTDADPIVTSFKDTNDIMLL